MPSVIPPEAGRWHGAFGYPCAWASSQNEDALEFHGGSWAPGLVGRGRREAGVNVRPERESRARERVERPPRGCCRPHGGVWQPSLGGWVIMEMRTSFISHC
jgi:hypothetical protein